ncbi:unnamed protein product [Amoebophrya sp. A120]|nr:unnamed protein product [Amoebophrya sp. A120]|eukprot:GSA120T00021126001.1
MSKRNNAGTGNAGGKNKLKRHGTTPTTDKFALDCGLPGYKVDTDVKQEARAVVRKKSYNLSNIKRDWINESADMGNLREAVNLFGALGTDVSESMRKATLLMEALNCGAWLNAFEILSVEEAEQWDSTTMTLVLERGETLIGNSQSWPVLYKIHSSFESKAAEFPLKEYHEELAMMVLKQIIEVCRCKRSYNSDGSVRTGTEQVVDFETAEEGELQDVAKVGAVKKVPKPVFKTLDCIKTWLLEFPELQKVLDTTYVKLVNDSCEDFLATIDQYIADDPKCVTSKLLKKLRPFVVNGVTFDERAENVKLLRNIALQNGALPPLATKDKMKKFAFKVTEILQAVSDDGESIMSLFMLGDRTARINRIKPFISQPLNKIVDGIEKEIKDFAKKFLPSTKHGVARHILNMEFKNYFINLKKAVSEVALSDEILAGMNEEWKKYALHVYTLMTTQVGVAIPVAALDFVKAASGVVGSYIGAHAKVILCMGPTFTVSSLTNLQALLKSAVDVLRKDHHAAMQHLGAMVELYQKKILQVDLAAIMQKATDYNKSVTVKVDELEKFRKEWKANKIMFLLDECEVCKLNPGCTWLRETQRKAANQYTEALDKATKRAAAAQLNANGGGNGNNAAQNAGVAGGRLAGNKEVLKKGKKL